MLTLTFFLSPLHSRSLEVVVDNGPILYRKNTEIAEKMPIFLAWQTTSTSRMPRCWDVTEMCTTNLSNLTLSCVLFAGQPLLTQAICCENMNLIVSMDVFCSRNISRSIPWMYNTHTQSPFTRVGIAHHFIPCTKWDKT